MKKIFKHILLTALTITAVASCADDRNNFIPDDSFGFNTVKNENVITVPIYGGTYDLTVIKSGKGINEGTAYFETSNAALLAYNEEFSTDYVPFPKDQDMYSFSTNSLAFSKEEVSKQVTLNWDVAKIGEYMKSEPDNNYAIPVVVKSEDLEVNDGRHLYILNLVKSTINAESTLLSQSYQWGSECKEAQRTLIVRIDTPITGKDLEIEFGADASAVDAYNEQYRAVNGEVYGDGAVADYELAPEGLITYESKVVIKDGEKYNKLVFNINPEQLLIDGENGKKVAKEFTGYVLPVRIKSMSIDDINVENDLVYVVVKGVPPAQPQLFKRLWGIYATSSEDPWNKQFGLSDCRNITMDDNYIYMVQNAVGTPVIKAISITDPNQVENVNMEGVISTTQEDADKGKILHSLSCVRMVKMQDGTDCLIASNLVGDNSPMTFYVWKNGISAPPTAFKDVDNAGRRLGDKFVTVGYFEKGEIYMNDFNTPNIARVAMSETDFGLWRDGGLSYLSGRFDYTPATAGLGSAYIYPGTEGAGTKEVPYFLCTSTGSGDWYTWRAAIPSTANHSYSASGELDLKMTHGYNFFKVGDKEYISWISIEGDNNMGAVHVIENPTATAEGVPAALKAYVGVQGVKAAATFPLQDELDTTMESPCPSTHGTGDCVVRTIGETTYMAAMIQNVGLSVFVLDPNYKESN